MLIHRFSEEFFAIIEAVHVVQRSAKSRGIGLNSALYNIIKVTAAAVVAGIIAIMFRSIGFLGKLLGEAIEEIDPAPIEALQACGASPFKVVLYGVVPQVAPAFFAISILRWDINLRESTVLGLVGAGGIGVILQGAIDTFQWQEVSMVLLTILALVIFGEVVSSTLRKKLI